MIYVLNEVLHLLTICSDSFFKFDIYSGLQNLISKDFRLFLYSLGHPKFKNLHHSIAEQKYSAKHSVI